MKKLLTGLPASTAPMESAITLTTEKKDGKTSRTLTVELSESGALKGAAVGALIAGPVGTTVGAVIGAVLGKAD